MEEFQIALRKHNCPDLISTKKVHKLVADVSADTKKRYVAHGKENFCEKNLSSYSDLSEAFKQNIDIFNNNGFKQKK